MARTPRGEEGEELAAEHHLDEDGERANEVKPCFTPPFLPLRIRVAYALSLLYWDEVRCICSGKRESACHAHVVISRSSEQRLCVVLSWRS